MNKKLQSEIARRNELFKGKSRAEKRVLVAQDVIAQIKAKTLIPSSGDWVYILDKYEPAYEASLRETVLNKEVECNCCALGGLFLSCTLFNNKVKVGDVSPTFGEYGFLDSTIYAEKKFSNGLNTIFSNEQLKLIEVAFECGCGAFYEDDVKDGEKAAKFGSRYNTEKGRMIGIMNNIIKNNGTFIP